MKRYLILIAAVICLAAIALLPVLLSDPLPANHASQDFNVDLAQTLIIVICSALTAAIALFTVVIAKRNLKA